MRARHLVAGYEYGSESEPLHLRAEAYWKTYDSLPLENASGLDRELRIAGKDPAAMLPWPDRICVEPTPHCAVADAGDQPELSRLLRHVGHTKARQRRTQRRRQFMPAP